MKLTNKFFIEFTFFRTDEIAGFDALEISRRLGITPVSVLPDIRPETLKIELGEEEARRLHGMEVSTYYGKKQVNFRETNHIRYDVEIGWDDLKKGEVSETWEQDANDPGQKTFSRYKFNLEKTWKDHFLVS